MITTNIFESSPVQAGADVLRQLQTAIDGGHDIDLKVGVEMMPLKYPEARFLRGIYKAYAKQGRQEEGLNLLGNASWIMSALDKLDAKLASYKTMGSVPGDRGVDEGVGDVMLEKEVSEVRSTRNPAHMSPSEYEQYQQNQMDWEKRDFKRREMEHELAGEEEAYRREMSGNWYIRINGKILKDKQGNPFTFRGKAAANKAALTMMAKPFNAGKKFTLTTSWSDAPPPSDVSEDKPGLWANIHAKRERIKHGSNERMREPGSKGAPTASAFKAAAKTSKKKVSEFAVGDGGEDPIDNYPCYDCGSTIFLHHTKLCELAEDNAIRDLPSKNPKTQHWNGVVPKGLHPIPGLNEGSVTKKPQPYNEPGWAKKLPKEKLDALAGTRYPKKDKKQKGVAEGAEFGSNYAEQLAQKVFDHNSNIKDENQVLNLGYNIAKNDLGSRAQGIFRDEDFPSDFVSAYFYLQKQGVAEAGPFSYGAKKPRKGSVAYNDLMKRKEQDRKRVKDIEAIGTKNHHVGVAKVTKDVAEDSLEEIDRRGFLRGMGAAALGAAGIKAQAGQTQDIGDGFELATINVAGHTVKAVLDTQTNIYYTLNRAENGSAILRSPAPFIMVRDGQVKMAMNVGPATAAAIKKAGLEKMQEGVAEGIESQYMAARYIDEFGDGDHWYVKGTPDVIKKFVLLANSLEDEAVKGTEYEPGKGMMSGVHAELGNDAAPQWTIVPARNLESIKPIGDKVLQRLMRPNLADGAQEFMSELLWAMEEKGLALVTDDSQQGVAEGSLNEVTQGVEHSEWADNVKDHYHPTPVRIIKKRSEDGRHIGSHAMVADKKVGQYNMKTGVGTFTALKKQGVAEDISSTKKKISKYEELALAANRAGDDAKCKQYQQKIQVLKQKMSQGVAEGYTGRETKDGTWRVFKDGQAVAVAGPFKSRDEAHAWIKNHKPGVSEAKSLKKRVRVVQGEHAGKTGWIREIKHGTHSTAPKRYYVDIDGGGQANNLPASALRLLKNQSDSQTGMAEATGDTKFDAMMGNIKKSAPVPVTGYVAVEYASENQSDRIKGVTLKGKPIPSSVDVDDLDGEIEFGPDEIERHLIKIGRDNGWSIIDPGHGRGYSELFFDTNANYTSDTQSILAKNIVNTVNQINKFFSGLNSSLQSTGLPGYKVAVWQEISSPNGQKIGDINQIKQIALTKVVHSPNDPGELIGQVILRELPAVEQDEYDDFTPEDFAYARKIAKIYITKGERAGLEAQVSNRRMDHVSDLIDELLSLAGAQKYRTLKLDDLDEVNKKMRTKPMLGQGVAEAGMPASVIKSKQRYSKMTPAEFAKAHADKSDEELKAMAWRHGYGKGSTYYVDKRNKGKKDVAEGLNEMDKSAPQPGRDGKISHSTYGSRDKKGSDYFKGKEAPGKAITAKQAAKDALDILKKQGVAEGEDIDTRIANLKDAIRFETPRSIPGERPEDQYIRHAEKIAGYKAELKKLVAQKKQQGVAEGNDDDIWGPQGNFAGDTKVELGNVSMKNIQVGDVVTYFGEKAKVLELGPTQARISANGKTLNVRKSDLKQLGRGVTEAFDQPYKLKWQQGDWDDVDAYAKLPDGNYLSIMFNNDANEEGEEAWSVEFYRNNSQEVTGEGDQQRIFATVLSAIQTFIKKYKPNRLIFSASKEVGPGQKSQSRANLYDRLVQRYAKALGFKAFKADAGNKVHYELSKINKGVAEGNSGAKYRVKSIGKDSRGDYYISPSTGKKVYKKARVGDHENPHTGEIKPKIAESDPSGLMHAAKHLNNEYIITAKTAEGNTKRYRVRAQSERTARERFAKHYSQAKIIKVENTSNINETQDDNPVMSSIIRRIMLSRPDLLKYGPGRVMDAVSSVAEFVGAVDEIGTSDVSAWVAQVERELKTHEG